MVLADKGQKKSPALNRLLKPVQKLKEKLICESEQQEDEVSLVRHKLFLQNEVLRDPQKNLNRSPGKIEQKGDISI